MPLYDPDKRPHKRVVPTQDGSTTLYSAEFDECYHSTRDGALNESLRKHVEPAFALQNGATRLTILDVCFGLGYNTLATLWYRMRLPRPPEVRILSPELDRELVASLEGFDYPEAFAPLRPVIAQIARTGRYEGDGIQIDVLFGDAREILETIDTSVDIVYQDPFSPKKNPLLWTREYFAQIRRIASERMILTTYSSATPVRMGMYENGFLLYEPPSAGVRPGTIAALRPLDLPPIDMELKKRRNPAAASLEDARFFQGDTGTEPR
ncbi:tRNA (5-methylaminomethyl-2-thiouridine)(34)-methyltransferase MnmD [Nitratifractor sp.]